MEYYSWCQDQDNTDGRNDGRDDGMDDGRDDGRDGSSDVRTGHMIVPATIINNLFPN